MLVCERWTLTHSSGGPAVPVPVPVPLAVRLGSELGLVLTSAASVAVVVLVAAVLAEAVPVPVGVDGEDPLDGSLTAAEWAAAGLLEFVECAGDGDGDGEGDLEGDGEGVGVPEVGKARHTVSVLPGVASGAACALSSGPRVKMLPLSKVTAATLTCAKRIQDRPSTLLVRITFCSFVIRTRLGARMGTCTHFR